MSDKYEGLGLTAEELAAVNTDDDGNAVDTADEAEEETTEEAAVEEAPVEEAKAEEAVDEATTGNPVLTEEPPKAFATEFKAQAVENIKENLSALDNRFAELTDALALKYEAGELDFKTYRKQERELTQEYHDRKGAMEKAQLKAEIAYEHSKQSSEALWQYEQKVFFADNKDFVGDDLLMGALSAKLQSMYADPANSGRDGLSLLREAGKAVRARLGGAATEAKSEEKKVAAIAEAKAKREAKPKPIPKTLADLPAAETNEDGGEFDFMDNLKGLDYERAITKMTEEQRARFLAA